MSVFYILLGGYMYKGMDISMILGTDDVTFIRFGNPAHFLKEAISRSDIVKDKAETPSLIISRKDKDERKEVVSD